MTQTYSKPAAIVFALTVFLLGAVPASAQNPFGDPDDNFGETNPFGTTPLGMGADAGVFGGAATPPPVQSNAAAGPADPDPVVRLLRSSPPKSPEQWSDALTWMTRIKRWDEVKRLLGELQTANWSLQEKASLARYGGAALWLRLKADEVELSEEQKKFVSDVLAAPGILAREPATVDKWIDRLASDKAGERQMSQMRLQDAGMVAVRRLVERLLEGDSLVDPTTLASTVVGFGRDGTEALRAACLVRDPQRASRVLLAVAKLPSNDFTAELGAGLSSRLHTPETQRELADRLTEKFGSLPDDTAIHDHLNKMFEDALVGYQMRRSNDEVVSSFVWRPTSDGRGVEWTEVSAAQAALERLAQLAVYRNQLKIATGEDLVEAGTALLQRGYHVNPTLDPGELSVELLAPIEEELATDAAYWQQVYEQADHWQMHGAALRAVQLLAENATSGKSQPPLDFLSRQLSDPRPIVRYAALQAIARIQPEHSFLGADRAIETAMEMTRLAGGPSSLVIGLQADLRQAASQLLAQQTGADVIEVNSGQAALLELQSSKPVELVFVVDRVSDMSIFELLQRLRKTENGQSLPIAVLTDSLYPHERELIGEMSGVVNSVLSRDAQHMERVVGMMLNALDTQPMSAADRFQFAQVGSDFLATIAKDRTRYAFYRLSDWREQLISTEGRFSLPAQMNIFAAVGSAEGQNNLTSLAATPSLRDSERMAAASAFAKSVRRFGMLLKRQDVLRNYEMYNQLGPNDPGAVKALGLVLDVIEAHAGKAEWPEGY